MSGGLESHELEEVQAGLVSADTSYAIYADPKAEWEQDKQILRPVSRKVLAKWSGLNLRSVKAIMNTTRIPHPENRRRLHEIAEKMRRRDPAPLEKMPGMASEESRGSRR